MASSSDLGLFAPPEQVAEVAQREQARNEQHGRLRRRLFLRWTGWAGAGLVLGQWLIGFLGFFWPQRVGAFGQTVAAGSVDEYQVGDVRAIREGRFYLVRVPEGFLALWWKCPHLGCTVPWKEDDPAMGGPPGNRDEGGDRSFAERGRFNCPCHSSIYNRYGQIVQGPAPRPMDRFPVRIADGRILVDTGPQHVVQRRVASADDAVAG